MKILLADPSWFTLQGVQASTVSLGLAQLAGVLEENGYDVALWNGDIYGGGNRAAERLVQENLAVNEKSGHSGHPAFSRFRSLLSEFSPDVVGITSMTADFFSAQILAGIVRETVPACKVVAGGVQATLVPAEVLADECIDYVVCGEGEDTFIELLKAIKNGDGQPNVAGAGYRRGGAAGINDPRPLIDDLDRLPLPSYKNLVDRDMHHPADLGGVISSRGCPYPCTYCASNRLWTRSVRYRSIGHVIREVERLHSTGVRLLRINDDAFTIKRARVENFCNRMSDFADMRWSCDTRAELIDDGLLRQMRRGGCYQINVGIETGSPRIQAMIKKNMDFDAAGKIFKKARAHGIKTTAYFMVGFPGETADEIKMTMKTARRLKADYPLFSTVTPYPGTEMWSNLVEAGKLKGRIDYSVFYHHSKAMNFSSLPPIDFERMITSINSMTKRIAFLRKLLFMLRHPLLFFKDRQILGSQLVRQIGGMQAAGK